MITALNPPTGLQEPYASTLRYGMGIAGALGLGLQKWLQKVKVAEPTLYDHVNRALDTIMQLSPEDRERLIKVLPTFSDAFKEAKPVG